MNRYPYDSTATPASGTEDVEVIADPVEIERIRDLWAEIQANPANPDDANALLAKLRDR